MIRKPDCTSLQLNPFNTYVSSTSIFNSAERTLRPLTPYSILANLSRPGWTNYTLEASNPDEHTTLQILSIDSTNGLLRMIRKPDCTSLQLNPFNIYVSSNSIFNSAERTLRPLTVTIFGKNCFSKLQRKVSWTAPVGTR
ncbi:hypothetical protein pdam_00018763, partial [Pocillopora damicornis]